MNPFLCILFLCVASLTLPNAVRADQTDPPAAQSGSASTMINGKPAVRAGDVTGAEGGAGDSSPSVMINGKPAAVGGKCPGGQAPTPSPNVFIDGKPALLCGG